MKLQFSHSVVSYSLRPHGQQQDRPPCPSPTPKTCSNSCPWVGDAIQPSHPLSSPSPPAFSLLSIRVFSSESVLFIRWPTYWSFSFSISLSNEYSAVISFKIDWFDLLAVQGALKCRLQHHSWKASIVQWSTFFIVRLSHSYMTTGKTVALTMWTFVGKIMSLLLNMLFRLVITFLPRSNCGLVSWLQSPSAVVFGAQEKKLCHCFHCFPIYLPWSDGTGCHDLSFLNVEF